MVKLSTRAVLTAVLSAVVAVAAYLGMVPLIVAVTLLVVAFAFGWSHLLRLPAVGGSSLVVVLAGLGSLACVAVTPDQPWLRYLPMVLAMSVFLAFINEMLRPYPRITLVDSLIGTVSGAVVAVCAAGWLATYRLDNGMELAVVAAGSLAVASAVSAVKLAEPIRSVVTVVAAGVAGVGGSYLLPHLTVIPGIVIGVLAALSLVAINLLFGKIRSKHGKAAVASVLTLPVAVVGIITYIAGRILL